MINHHHEEMNEPLIGVHDVLALFIFYYWQQNYVIMKQMFAYLLFSHDK
jgi:hypothetical protein